MSAVRIETPASYLKLLREKPAEAELLRKELLIGVTQFFRGRPAFDFLSKEIIPNLVIQPKDARAIRIWCPGCSTGEEPYSLAMLFLEAFEELKRPARLQIFASDINADAVAFARDGLYPNTIEADIAPDRLAQFFTREDHHYRVTHELRDCVVFTVHDILADAPFSNIDFVCCRNLLIYLQPEAPHKILSFFRFALRDGVLESVSSPFQRNIAFIVTWAAAGRERWRFRRSPRRASESLWRSPRSLRQNKRPTSTLCLGAL
jgi:two-component system CheB/CheR fusion protein